MKNVLVLLFLICSVSVRIIGQNSICQVNVINQNIGANLMIEFNSGEIINLKTRFRKNQIQSIDCYGNREFVLILIEPISSYNEYIINGAFKLQTEWIQDYQDRNYFIPSSGLTCTQISSIKIMDEQTLRVEYETSTSFGENFKVATNLILGKHSILNEHSKMRYGYMFKAVNHSPRLNH